LLMTTVRHGCLLSTIDFLLISTTFERRQFWFLGIAIPPTGALGLIAKPIVCTIYHPLTVAGLKTSLFAVKLVRV